MTECPLKRPAHSRCIPYSDGSISCATRQVNGQVGRSEWEDDPIRRAEAPHSRDWFASGHPVFGNHPACER